MAARLKRAAYGLNDAPRLWWNRLDKALRSYGLVPTRADRCCYVLYSSASSLRRKSTTQCGTKGSVTFADDLDTTVWEARAPTPTSASHTLLSNPQASETGGGLNRTSNLDIEGAIELLLDPITGSPARHKRVEGVVTIHVDDALMLSLIHI